MLFTFHYKKQQERSQQQERPQQQQQRRPQQQERREVKPVAAYSSLQAASPIISSQTPSDKPIWGSRTWLFFHAIAAKIKESDFSIVKDELFGLIDRICNNLPCPICSNHASEYLRNNNMRRLVRCKSDLIKYFFVFHNVVNQRKKYPLYQESNLDVYNTANLPKIFQAFIVAFEDRNKNLNMMNNNLLRYRVSSELIQWFQINNKYFD